jgi:hypothetical protein
MTYFYRFMIWSITLELAIARSTGRNPANVQQLQCELNEYELLLFKREMMI